MYALLHNINESITHHKSALLVFALNDTYFEILQHTQQQVQVNSFITHVSLALGKSDAFLKVKTEAGRE